MSSVGGGSLLTAEGESVTMHSLRLASPVVQYKYLPVQGFAGVLVDLAAPGAA